MKEVVDQTDMTQCGRLLRWLQTFKQIDPLEAWRKLGIYRLASRICDLKKQGHVITKGTIKVKNVYGEECSVALYTLETKLTQGELNV